MNVERAQMQSEVRFEPLLQLDEEDPIALGRTLFSLALAQRATDIQLRPWQDEYHVRVRIDGRMEDLTKLTRAAGHALINQWKIAADLSIADPFHHQEAKLPLADELGDYDARLTTAMILGGETAAIRLLNRRQLVRPFAELGFARDCLTRVQWLLQHGEGIVLITGPTGVGKTTTLYSIIHALDDGHRNILSIEDPVEFDIPSIQQMEVDERHGVTFAKGLKTLLRLDPDVIMIGEIRDPETAAVAMRAASSGKYVFTTFHTRDIASTVTGLRDLQVDSRSMSGNLRGIIAQRLVRRVCLACRGQKAPDEEARKLFDLHHVPVPDTLPVAVGCETCRHTGYFGRIGVFEVEANNRELAMAIERGQPEDAIRQRLRADGGQSLASDALQKVADGFTTLEDARRMSWVEME